MTKLKLKTGKYKFETDNILGYKFITILENLGSNDHNIVEFLCETEYGLDVLAGDDISMCTDHYRVVK